MTTTGRAAAAAATVAAAATTFWWGTGAKMSALERNVTPVAARSRRSKLSVTSSPIHPQTRFLRYATRDADNREVLDPVGFVACVCLLDDGDWERLARDLESPISTRVRNLMEHLLQLMGMDHGRTITYDDFCVLLTLISTRRRQMQLAFGVFDHNEDSYLSKEEFLNLLNGLMVDPKVRILQSRLSEREQLLPSQAHCKGASASEPCSKWETKTHTVNTSSVGNDVLPLAKRFWGQRGKDSVSFDEVWSTLCEIRCKIRALEFSLYDPRNTNEISLQNFKRIIACDGSEENANDHTEQEADGGNEFISWDFYLKMFDVLFESDAISHAMNLALRARPPPEQEERRQHQTEAGAAASGTILTSSASAAGCPVDLELDTTELQHVLEVSSGFSHLTKDDVEQMVRLFDADHSGKLSPTEFAQMCQLRASFFTPRESRLSAPKRNTLQQFIFCMQQLK